MRRFTLKWGKQPTSHCDCEAVCRPEIRIISELWACRDLHSLFRSWVNTNFMRESVIYVFHGTYMATYITISLLDTSNTCSIFSSKDFIVLQSSFNSHAYV